MNNIVSKILNLFEGNLADEKNSERSLGFRADESFSQRAANSTAGQQSQLQEYENTSPRKVSFPLFSVSN